MSNEPMAYTPNIESLDNIVSPDVAAYWTSVGAANAEERIIKLLLELDVIRKDVFGHWVAFDTYGEKVVYLDGLESKK
jgi:hypothetical protein